MPRSVETRFYPREDADEETIMRCHVLNFIINIDRNMLIGGDFTLKCPRIDNRSVAIDNFPTPFGARTEIFHKGEFDGFVIDLFLVTGDNTGYALMQGRVWDEAIMGESRSAPEQEKDKHSLLEGKDLYQYLIEGLVRTADLYNDYGEWRATAPKEELVYSIGKRDDSTPKQPIKPRQRT